MVFGIIPIFIIALCIKNNFFGVNMQVKDFIETLQSDFYTGVPDSLLKPLCNYLMDKYGNNNNRHIIAANEGNATAIAAGYHLATNKIPVVYMQNSGEGNIVNPVASLLSDKVYAIPMIFIIGWRGEPGVKDEPQHIFQSTITLKLLDDLNISYFILRRETIADELQAVMKNFREDLSKGKQVAFVVCKNALSFDKDVFYSNGNKMLREDALRRIIAISDKDIVVSTTGKISRELFSIREENKQSHEYDFLTVGSMGHASSIALGLAMQLKDRRIWCIDGDGALLMHMGALAVIGANNLQNFIHIVINNESHESVGGMPTVAGLIKISEIARACNYRHVASVNSYAELDNELSYIKANHQLSFLEIKTSVSSRHDLGRPTISPIDNKNNFMRSILK